MGSGRLILVLLACALATGPVRAQTSREAEIQRLRGLMGSGQWQAVEAGADSLLGSASLTTRADSLALSDAQGLWVESRMRQGKTLVKPTPERIEALLGFREALFGPRGLDVALGLDFLGILRREQGESRAARAAFERALQIREARLGARHLETARSLNQLATLAFAVRDFASARTGLARALEIYESQLPANHPALGAPLLNLALARIAMEDTTGVRLGLTRAYRIFEESLGPTHPLLPRTLIDLGDWAIARGAWDEAAEALGRARTLCETHAAGGPEHADALLSIGRLNLALGRADSALADANTAQTLIDALHGSRSARAAAVMVLRADAARAVGTPETARSLYAQASSVLARVDAADSLQLADALEGAALLEAESEQPARALPLYERVLRIELRQQPPRTRELAQALMGRASAQRAVSLFDSAATGYALARQLIERTLPAAHPLRADPFMGLATLALDRGDLARARAYADTALTLRRRTLPPLHPRLAETLHLLGSIEKGLGNLDSARVLLGRGLAIAETRPGQENQTAALLNSIGIIERQQGHPEQARRNFERAIGGELANPNVSWRIRVLALRNLGSLANAAGDHTSAADRYADALALHERNGDPLEADRASIVLGLGNAEKGRGRHAQALSHYRAALRMHQQVLGGAHPAIALDEHNLAATLLETGALEAALDTALLAEGVSRQHLRLVAAGLPEREALHYAAGRVRGLDIALTSAARLPDTTVWRRAWDGVIRSRSLVLDEMADRRRTIAETRDPELARLAEALSKASDRLAHLTVSGRGSMTVDRYRDQLQRAMQSRDQAERALAERSDAFRRGQARREIGFREVAASLPRNTALVAYVRFSRFESERAAGSAAPTDRPRAGVPWYGAFVLKGPDQPVRFLTLAPAAVIEERVAVWQQQAAVGWKGDPVLAENAYRTAGRALRESIWDSLATSLEKAERVFVVPDGVLQLVNLSTLPVGTKSYLIEDGPRLHLLSTERDLAELNAIPSVGKGILTTASVDFMKASAPMRSTPVAGTGRHRGAQCAAFQTMWFDSLPGTRVEQGDVIRLWRKYSSRLPVGSETRARREENSLMLELAGPAASEQAVRASAPGRSVLHLATHGFFLSRECAGSSASEDAAGDEDALEALPVDQQSPLLLSGLALAGANSRDQAASGENDGILTAEEIASLDLNGVDWAVLSACQTGLGEVRAGEGVFGLRRAFEVAGARTLIMSLWAVDDRSAALWMEALFERRLRSRRSTADAVHEATLEALRERRSQGRSGHPYFWGAFVAVGGWS